MDHVLLANSGGKEVVETTDAAGAFAPQYFGLVANTGGKAVVKMTDDTGASAPQRCGSGILLLLEPKRLP